jgi:hypothetical protein
MMFLRESRGCIKTVSTKCIGDKKEKGAFARHLFLKVNHSFL